MANTLTHWAFDVERGPDCLFVRAPRQQGVAIDTFGEDLWQLLETHLTFRVVLEFDPSIVFLSSLVGQLVLLHKRIHQRGGLLRLSGVSPSNCEVLQTCQLQSRIPCYSTRQEAILASSPRKPR